MKVYQYGVGKKIPARLPDEVFQQFRLQNRFWNALVECENKFQERYNNLLSESDQELTRLEQEIAAGLDEQSELRTRIKQERKRARGNVDVALLQKKVGLVKERLKSLRQERKELRARIKERIRPALRELDAERKAEVKRLRQEFAAQGLYWCNYNAVVDSYNRARQGIFKKRSQGRPARMNFHRFTGEGRLTVQIQGGMTAQDLLSGASNQLQIDPPRPEAWTHPIRGERKRLRKTLARIRIGSNGRDPLWFEFPVTMHRPIPGGARIKTAQLKRQKIGTGWRWRLNITVEEPEPEPVPLPHETIALDVGWRKTEAGLRAAAYADTEGNAGEVRLDESYLLTNERLIGLQSTIDTQFGAILQQLGEWLRDTDMPEWLAEETSGIYAWRSPMRLVRLISRWEQNRFAADTDIFPALLYWRDKYLHLYNWQSNLRDKMHGRRREEFRMFAKRIARNYSRILIEDFDMSRTARRATPEDGVDHSSAARHYHKLAAPGELRDEVIRAAAATGAEIVRVDPRNTTRTCPHCRELVDADFSRSIFTACDKCGFVYDQDIGAARNMLGSRNSPEGITVAG